MVSGNRQIWLTELKEDLSAPKPGGLHRMIFKDTDEIGLGYEGSHIYKINGKYYVFNISIGRRCGASRVLCQIRLPANLPERTCCRMTWVKYSADMAGSG